MEKLIEKYLKAGLLPELSSNEHHRYIELCVNELKKKVEKRPLKMIEYTIAAMDPNLNLDNPVATEIDETLRKFWKTIHNVSAEPRQVWKAVLWEALNARARDVDARAIVWNTAASQIGLTVTDVNESEVLNSFLFSLRDSVEDQIEKEIETGGRGLIQAESNGFPEIELKPMATETFKQDLLKASGPTDGANAALEDANPNWPNTNAAWSTVFSEKASKAIGLRITSSGRQIIEAMKQYGEALSTNQTKFFEAIASGGTYKDIANDLLWWKQALYSRKLRKGYRELPKEIVPLVIALDAHSIVNGVHPIGFEYLIAETLRDIAIFRPDETFKLDELIAGNLGNADASKALEAYAAYYKNMDHNLPLAAIVKRAVETNNANPAELRSRGISSKEKITAVDFTTWLFRDLQAYGIAMKVQK